MHVSASAKARCAPARSSQGSGLGRRSRLSFRRGGKHVTRHKHERGFTLVELVVVMVLVAVITTVGLARFADREPFAVQATADQLLSGLRLAQATALAQRAPVFVSLGADPVTLTLCLDAPCTQPLAAPGGGPWLENTDGVRLTAALTYSVDGRGEPSFASAQTVQVSSSDGSVNAPAIRIEAVSGHVHVP